VSELEDHYWLLAFAERLQFDPALTQTIPLHCLDRCFADFKTCLGVPPRNDPRTTLPNGRGVPTPPSFDECKRARDECEAACMPPPKR